MAIPDSWSEVCFVSISLAAGAWQTYQALTETIDIDGGEKNVEWVPVVGGGRVAKFVPETEKTITFEAYPIDVGTATTAAGAGTGFYDLLYTNATTTEPQTIVSDRTRVRTKIVLTWTSIVATKATDAIIVTPSNAALRMQFAEGYVTSVKKSFTDGVLKFTVEAKFPPFDKDGTAALTYESMNITSGGTTTTMASVGAYT